MFITSYTKDPPDTVKLKERESDQQLPSGEKEIEG